METEYGVPPAFCCCWHECFKPASVQENLSGWLYYSVLCVVFNGHKSSKRGCLVGSFRVQSMAGPCSALARGSPSIGHPPKSCRAGAGDRARPSRLPGTHRARHLHHVRCICPSPYSSVCFCCICRLLSFFTHFLHFKNRVQFILTLVQFISPPYIKYIFV